MIKMLFDSWTGHTVDNSIVDLEDGAYMVIVVDDGEEEKSPQKPSQCQ
jgi:hypothetical protein